MHRIINLTDFCTVKYSWLPAVLIILLGCIWGSSFILMKRGLLVFSPLQVAGTRLILAGAVLLPWVLKYTFFKPNDPADSSKKILEKSDYLWLIASGVLGNAIPAFLFSYAGKLIPSGLSGILNAFTPLFTLFFSAFLFREKFTREGGIGVIMGIIGALFLFGPSLLSYGQPINLLGASLPLLAALLYGLNINIIKHKLSHLPGMVKTAYPFVSVGIIYAVILSQTNYFDAWEQYPGGVFREGFGFFDEGNISANSAFLYLFLLGFMGSAVSMIIFNWVIKYVSSLVASTNTFIIPVTAVFWGFADHESLSWNIYVGMFFLLAAVFLIIRPKKS